MRHKGAHSPDLAASRAARLGRKTLSDPLPETAGNTVAIDPYHLSRTRPCSMAAPGRLDRGAVAGEDPHAAPTARFGAPQPVFPV